MNDELTPEDNGQGKDGNTDPYKLGKLHFLKPQETAPNFHGAYHRPDLENDKKEPPPIPPPPNPPKTNSPAPDGSPDWKKFAVSDAEIKQLLAFRPDNESRNTAIVFIVGVLLSGITVAGALIGYVRAYNRFFRVLQFRPVFHPMFPITRVAMVIGAIAAWIVTLGVIAVLYLIINLSGYKSGFVMGYLVVNTVMTGIVFGSFKYWQVKINNSFVEGNKFGSARFAYDHELYTLQNDTGYFIGQGHAFNDKGHILTVAGTRGGKGTNIIVPNLLGVAEIETSWVVIDPKGENAAVTANYQRQSGQNVIVLNPWDLLAENVGTAQSYNPLDMLDITSKDLVDDVQVLAEMIVPIDPGAKDKFWTDSARTIVSGLLLYLVVSQPKEKRTLATLWDWVRKVGEDWDKLIQDMGTNDDKVNQKIIDNSANEILKLQAAGDETFGGIISNVLQATDFLKSPALQKSLESGFDPKVLADGKTTVYVIIPADKLKSHGRWLRLVVTSMMRAVIRKPQKRVTFLLDEFAALGYLPEIETALSTYAGYNVTVWPILQSLIQLQHSYKDNWETFIANCTIRQYFTINDNFSAEYISKALGDKSHVIVKGDEAKANARRLVTPDELRRTSGKSIFMFISDLHPTMVDKMPYYLVPELAKKAQKNPYI